MTRQILPPDIDDRYKLGDLLGTGGSGAVYNAVDRRSGSTVAVKILHQPLVDDAARVRFEREVAAHARLDDVPGVVRVHAHGVADQRGWLAMDRYSSTIAARLASVGALSAGEAVAVLADCAEALEAIHDAGMLHRDIKPSNLFIGADGRTVLADLGIVQISGEPTLTGMTPLSLQWAAPETIETGESSVATDIYSLGTTAFTLLQGRPPFNLASGPASSTDAEQSDDSTIAVGPALRLIASGARPELDDAVPVGLRELIGDMIAVDPARRPATASEVRRRLRNLDGPEAARRTSTRSGRLPKLVGAAMLVALALGVGMWATQRNAGIAEVSSAATQPLLSPTSEPEPEPQAEPEPEVELAEPAVAACGGRVVWCDRLVLGDFRFTGDETIATFAQVDTDFGTAFEVTPGPSSDGGFSAERSLVGIGSTDTIAMRLRVLIGELPAQNGSGEGGEWFETLATISDERGNQWTVNAMGRPEGVYFTTGFFAPEDTSGGGSTPTTFSVGQWQCVELVLDAAAPTPVELLVNDESLIGLPDRAAADHGVGFLLSLGPAWLEGAEQAPVITLADVAVGDSPIGC